MTTSIEITREFKPQFHSALNHDNTCAPELISVVLQEQKTNKVLYVATMDKIALALTLETRRVHLYSRTAKSARRKGAISGNELVVKSIAVNCNQDSLLIAVDLLRQGACHVQKSDGTPYSGCFFRELVIKTNDLMFIE